MFLITTSDDYIEIIIIIRKNELQKQENKWFKQSKLFNWKTKEETAVTMRENAQTNDLNN